MQTFSAILATLVAVSVSAQTSLLEQARAAIDRGDNDAAIAVLEQAVAQYPNSAAAQFSLFKAYGSKAQSVGIFRALKFAAKAKAAAEKAVTLDPSNVEARFGLVQMYAVAPTVLGGSQEKALAQAKELKARDALMGHRAYALVYSQNKKFELAKKEYLEAVREQPNSARAHTYFGQYLENVEKNYSAATAEFETALKLDATHMPALYHLGKTAALANANLARGEEALEKYRSYTPKESEPPLASAHYYLGSIYEKQGRKLEAKQSYQAALKLSPTHKQAMAALRRVS